MMKQESLFPVTAIQHPHLGLGPSDDMIWRNRLSQKDPTIDGRPVSDVGICTENRRSCIHGDIVIECRMPLDTASQSPRLVDREALGAQRDPLIDLAIGSDVGGLSDDDPRPMINEEGLADGRPWMNINPGSGMGMLMEHSRNQRDLQAMQRVGDPVDRDGVDTRVADHGFIRMSGGGISVIGCLNITTQQAAYFRQLPDECSQDPICLGIQFLRGFLDLTAMSGRIRISKRSGHLSTKIIGNLEQKI